MTIGEFIKKQRLEYGLTQEEVAAKIGVTKLTILRWENGITQKIPVNKTDLLATTLHTTTDELLNIESEEPVEVPATKGTASTITEIAGNLIGHNPDGSYNSEILSKKEYHALMVVLQTIRNKK